MTDIEQQVRTMNSHKEHIEEFEKNQQWFILYFKDIILNYRDKFIVVWNQKVIETDKDLESLSQKVKKKTEGAKEYILDLQAISPSR